MAVLSDAIWPSNFALFLWLPLSVLDVALKRLLDTLLGSWWKLCPRRLCLLRLSRRVFRPLGRAAHLNDIIYDDDELIRRQKTVGQSWFVLFCCCSYTRFLNCPFFVASQSNGITLPGPSETIPSAHVDAKCHTLQKHISHISHFTTIAFRIIIYRRYSAVVCRE